MIFSAGSEHWAGFLLLFDNKKQFPSWRDTKDTLEKVKLYFLSYIKFDNKEEHLIGWSVQLNWARLGRTAQN